MSLILYIVKVIVRTYLRIKSTVIKELTLYMIRVQREIKLHPNTNSAMKHFDMQFYLYILIFINYDLFEL